MMALQYLSAFVFAMAGLAMVQATSPAGALPADAVSPAALITTTLVTSITNGAAAPTAVPTPVQPGISANCTNYYHVNLGDSCSVVATQSNITLADFYSWNPAIHSNCDNLLADYWVCIGVSVPVVAPPTTTPLPTTTPPPSVTPAPPAPQMPDIVDACIKYYLVKPGDTCQAIDLLEGITLSQFLSWNPHINPSCTNLWLGYWVCIGV